MKLKAAEGQEGEDQTMKVLSLFDGISCGMLALEREEISVERYVAFEIDKAAIEISKKNYPQIEQRGDVRTADFSEFAGFDLLIGGSPCQGFSTAGKGLNFEDPRSKLFFEYVRALKEVKPKYFLLENVRMKKEFQDIISEQLGVEPILINSELVSGQKRSRLYWTNIPGVQKPQDKGILLSDILEHGYVTNKKSYCIVANYYKGGTIKDFFEKHRRQQVFEVPIEYNRKDLIRGNIEKSLSILASDWRGLNRNQTQNAVLYTTDDGITFYVRSLSPVECERLQTLPDNYTAGQSNKQRYQCIGNGWTVDVIAHIFSYIPKN